MEEKQHHHIRFDKGNVAGIFDDDGNLIIKVDKVIIHADDIIIIKKDDDKHHEHKHHDDHKHKQHDHHGGDRESKRKPFWFD
ncbi:hypothetical protein [Niallia endozanthoxylica]|uniref:Uncharacterized protein n=1 Tax=Niallia endozanthoxylica TaxID=2036016 RepID=A0A5J5H2S6_9BACI|nr:hypothetical protein [Niallia endozanthoxylica]KAA9014213.1 hypothetical protein F4V44_24170 [Niallia endozanthoxylica]